MPLPGDMGARTEPFYEEEIGPSEPSWVRNSPYYMGVRGVNVKLERTVLKMWRAQRRARLTEEKQ